MAKSIEIASVKLNLKGKEIELSVADARELKAALDALLGSSSTTYPIYVHPYPANPPYWYTKPFYQLNSGDSTVPTSAANPTKTFWESTSGNVTLNLVGGDQPLQC